MIFGSFSSLLELSLAGGLVLLGGGTSSFFSSISVVISSIGFGGGVVAIVQPIHAPMSKDGDECYENGNRRLRQSLTLCCVADRPLDPGSIY